MLSQQVSHARIRIQEKRQASESAMFDNWFGTAHCDLLETGNEYHVVYERTEVPTGEAGIRIHDVIS